MTPFIVDLAVPADAPDAADARMGAEGTAESPPSPPATPPPIVSPEAHSLANGRPAGVAAYAATLIQTHSLELTFFIVDVGATARLYEHMVKAMPRVHPHYAVKCYPDPQILQTLAHLGSGFDCASAAEAAAILDLGVSADRIVFANPSKRPTDLRTIAAAGIPHTTFDSVCELRKIATASPNCGAVLRIRADDLSARLPFGSKYGAMDDEVGPLLQAAHELGVRLAGVSFHVGSGSGSSAAFAVAIREARQIFDLHAAMQHDRGEAPTMALLDIGGGMAGGFDDHGVAYIAPGDLSDVVNQALDEFFPLAEYPDLRVISEPGRYFAETSASVLTRIYTKRQRWIEPEEPEAGATNLAQPMVENQYWITGGTAVFHPPPHTHTKAQPVPPPSPPPHLPHQTL